MNLFTKEEINRCILTPQQASWFKRQSVPIQLKDDLTGSVVEAWVKPNGEIYFERITLNSPQGPELNFHHPDFKHFQSERWNLT